MERACLTENKARFSQSTWARTPFTQPPLLTDFSYLVAGAQAKEVLRCEFIPPPRFAPYVSLLLNALKMPEEILQAPPVSTVLTTNDYIKGWNNAREYTLVGPSGYHFRCAIASSKHQDLADFEATMTNISYA